jgi:hypothetical protein
MKLEKQNSAEGRERTKTDLAADPKFDTQSVNLRKYTWNPSQHIFKSIVQIESDSCCLKLQAFIKINQSSGTFVLECHEIRCMKLNFTKSTIFNT